MVHANAALGQHSSFGATTLSDLRAIMEVGFGATLALFHAVWPVMKAQGGGRLLATSSSAGRFGGAGSGWDALGDRLPRRVDDHRCENKIHQVLL
jgi:NAD(P)-dependent dehydrogenase (short-subunit alcohol dehydrogenase family)